MENIAKSTTDLRVEFLYQSLKIESYPFAFTNIKISTKVQLQNIDQTRLQNLDLNSASKSWQILASKSWPKFSFKVLLQILDLTSPSISKHLKGQLDPLVRQVTFLDHQGGQSIKMKSTHIMIGNSNNIKKFWVGLFRVVSVKSTKQQLVS